MSLKKMMMKLAIAMVAAKGGQMYAQAGGLEGIKRKLAQQKQSGGGIGAMLGNLASAGGGGVAPQKAEHLRGLLDTTATPEVPEEAEAGLVIRAMVMAAKADGEIDTAERAALWDVLGESTAPNDAFDEAFVEAALNAPVDAEALARDVPAGLELEIYTAAVLGITPDNRDEAQFLHALAERLGLDKTTVNDVHLAQGKVPLYTL